MKNPFIRIGKEVTEYFIAGARALRENRTSFSLIGGPWAVLNVYKAALSVYERLSASAIPNVVDLNYEANYIRHSSSLEVEGCWLGDIACIAAKLLYIGSLELPSAHVSLLRQDIFSTDPFLNCAYSQLDAHAIV
jgi:hypothetical protein